jgi:hypothetical protein
MTAEESALLVSTLAPLCKQHGVRRVKIADFEMEFGGGAPTPAEMKEFGKMLDKSEVSDMDVLMHSSPGGPMSKEELERLAAMGG